MKSGLMLKVLVGMVLLGVGVGSADELQINYKPQTSATKYIQVNHSNWFGLDSEREGNDVIDSPWLNPLPDVLLFSDNPIVTQEEPDKVKLKKDARPLDSISTFTCYVEGIDAIEPNEPTDILFETKSGDYHGNNVLAYFYDNIGTPSDPNWIYTGTTIDAKIAGDTPSTSYATVYVKNGLSNIMQVKFFPPEDVDFSGNVDISDFSLLASNWQTTFGTGVRTPYSPTDNPEYYADINEDGTVDILDLSDLCLYWLWEKPVYEIDAYDPIGG